MKSRRFLKNTAKLLHIIKKHSFLIIFIILVFFQGGCAPTYPKERLPESLVDICKKKHDVDVQVKLIGKNIVVFVPLDELFDINSDILPNAVNKIENVILSTSRVLFSTDADVDFYTIIAADVNVTAAEVILIRCMDDVYKFVHGWIGREEYRNRMLWQANYNIELIRDSGFDFNIEEMTMPVFLAEQIAQRTNLVLNSAIVHKAKIAGTYSEKHKMFFFSIHVNDNTKFTKVYAPIIFNIADFVLSQYKFMDFEQLVAKNQALKNTVILDKDDLKQYRDVDVDQLLTLPYYD